MSNIIVIGIAGGSASGKTTVAVRLKQEFKDNVELLCHDSYYLAHDDMPYEKRVNINYDHPNAFDTQRMIADIKRLKNQESIDCPVYSYSEHNRTNQTVHINAAQVIIVEGILIFENKELRDLMDIKIYVDTDADERLIRRILRDVKERNRSLESVITQYSNTVKPMHEQFVEATKKFADIVIPRGGENDVAIAMVINRIKAFLDGQS